MLEEFLERGDETILLKNMTAYFAKVNNQVKKVGMKDGNTVLEGYEDSSQFKTPEK